MYYHSNMSYRRQSLLTRNLARRLLGSSRSQQLPLGGIWRQLALIESCQQMYTQLKVYRQSHSLTAYNWVKYCQMLTSETASKKSPRRVPCVLVTEQLLSYFRLSLCSLLSLLSSLCMEGIADFRNLLL